MPPPGRGSPLTPGPLISAESAFGFPEVGQGKDRDHDPVRTVPARRTAEDKTRSYAPLARIAARTAPGGSHAIGDFLKSFAFRVTIQTAFTFTAHAV